MRDSSLISRRLFQKYCGDISRSTLRFYDKKGILKPIFRDDNGYQYYDISQLYTYFHIAMLRKMDCSIGEIEQVFMKPSVCYTELLESKLKVLKDKIQHFEQIRDSVEMMCNINKFCKKEYIGIPRLIHSDVSLMYEFVPEESENVYDQLCLLEHRHRTINMYNVDSMYMLYPFGFEIDKEVFCSGSNDYCGYMRAVRATSITSNEKTLSKTETGNLVLCYYVAKHPLCKSEYFDCVREFIEDNNYKILSNVYASTIPYDINEDTQAEYLHLIYVHVEE